MSRDPARASGSSQGNVGLKSLWDEAAVLPHISNADIARHIAERGWSNIVRAPLTSLVSTLTIAIALLLLSAVVLLVQNVGQGLSSSRESLAVSLYLQDAATEAQSESLLQEIRKRGDVESVKLLSKAEALAEFRRALGDEAVILEGLQGRNPLPITIEVRLKAEEEQSPQYEAFAAAFKDFPGVDHIQYSSGLLQQLNALVKSFRWIGLLSVLVVLILTGFIISNTIRLALYSHRDEIEIMRLVGATDRFIRAPYLLEGAAQGFVAGVVGLCFSYLLVLSLRSVAGQLAAQGIFSGTVAFLSPLWAVFLLLVGAGVGLLGSWLAVRRFLPE